MAGWQDGSWMGEGDGEEEHHDGGECGAFGGEGVD